MNLPAHGSPFYGAHINPTAAILIQEYVVLLSRAVAKTKVVFVAYCEKEIVISTLSSREDKYCITLPTGSGDLRSVRT